MDRSEFLLNVWNPYPPMPVETGTQKVVAGRVHSFENLHDGGWKLILLRDGQKKVLHFASTPETGKYLVIGDVVAVILPMELILLAPQKSSLPARKYDRELLHNWNAYLAELRSFFINKDFMELKTPGLVDCPGTEPALDVFSTEYKIGSKIEKLFLPTSPELHLKKALALGADKIFEMATCYRNGEITERHQPEFLMLEWYRAYDNLMTIKEDVIELVSSLSEKLGRSGPRQVLSYTVAELFRKYCNFELTPETSVEQLKKLAQNLNVDVHSADCIDDFFFLIFIEKIETQLPKEDLIFVEKYPPYQAALARLTQDGWGDRFEAYWQGLELCNAFHELNDPEIQRFRSLQDLHKKSETGKEPIRLDEEFFLCLSAGMPPSGGIALGVERLFMSFFGITQISEVRLFPR